jgi:hypothetical protein
MADEHSALEVRITPTVERDYTRRNIFPELRLVKAPRYMNATGIFEVPLDIAEQLLSDAETQYMNRALPRGSAKAYGSLIDQLKPAVKRAKGLWDDPGAVVVAQRHAESLAQYRIGEKVRYWSDWTDDEADGDVLEIVEDYGLRAVTSEEGEYVDSSGVRFAYVPGYRVKKPGSDEVHFCRPGNLQSLDYKREHLKLVYSKAGSAVSSMTAIRAL